MLLLTLVTPLLAAAIASPSPPPERQLQTIVTVISSPYCNSIADHFNGALLPMLANDRVFDETNVQLTDLNTLFDHPNYVQSFVDVRTAIGRQETMVNESLAAIQRQIVALREGARLSADAQATAQITQASWQLQTAYDHQRQLAIDLGNMHESMMRYPITRVNPALGGFNEREMTQPEDMRDIKSYLDFDHQRAVIDQNEDQAVDTAYLAAQTYCVPKK